LRPHVRVTTEEEAPRAVDEHEAAHLGVAVQGHVPPAPDQRERCHATELSQHDSLPDHRREPPDPGGRRDLGPAAEPEEQLRHGWRREEDQPEEHVAPAEAHGQDLPHTPPAARRIFLNRALNCGRSTISILTGILYGASLPLEDSRMPRRSEARGSAA